jgi:predicted transcriptional regulator
MVSTMTVGATRCTIMHRHAKVCAEDHMKRTAIHLTEEQAEKLEKIAERNSATTAALIRKAVDQFLEREEARQVLLDAFEKEQEKLKRRKK